MLLRSYRIEHELVSIAVDTTEPEGFPFFMGDLLARLRQIFPDIDAHETVDACKRLWATKVLALRKYNGATMSFRDYQGEYEDNAFFYGGTFHVKRTAFSRPYLERLKAALRPDEPTAPPKNPIGFV